MENKRPRIPRDEYYQWPDPMDCPMCGKTFVPAFRHTYAIYKDARYQKVCSHKCARDWQKKGGKSRGC